MLRITKDEKGFTLIELMVVIVVIGILMGVMGMAYTGMIKRAENLKIDANLRNLYMAARVAVLDGQGATLEEQEDIEALVDWFETEGYLGKGDIDTDEIEEYTVDVDGDGRDATVTATYKEGEDGERTYPSN